MKETKETPAIYPEYVRRGDSLITTVFKEDKNGDLVEIIVNDSFSDIDKRSLDYFEMKVHLTVLFLEIKDEIGRVKDDEYWQHEYRKHLPKPTKLKRDIAESLLEDPTLGICITHDDPNKKRREMVVKNFKHYIN